MEFSFWVFSRRLECLLTPWRVALGKDFGVLRDTRMPIFFDGGFFFSILWDIRTESNDRILNGAYLALLLFWDRVAILASL